MRKIPKFYVSSWCGNFVEMHCFGIVSAEFRAICPIPQNFYIRKLYEITVIYDVSLIKKEMLNRM